MDLYNPLKSTAMKLGLKLSFIFSVPFAFMSMAQQQVHYSQYMYNTSMVNPAYVGTSNRMEAQLIHRSQWVKIDGAPVTQNFGIQGKIAKNLGLGLNVLNDAVGPAKTFQANAQVAANVRLGENIRLSAGLNAGIESLSVDWTKGRMQDQSDEVMMTNISNRIKPLVGAGLYLYDDNWYFGASIPNFIEYDRYSVLEEQMINGRSHFNFIGGYVFHFENFKLKPAAMIKMVLGAPVNFDVSLNALLYEKVTIGAGFRHRDAVSAHVAYTINKSFMLGYSYDFGISKLRNHNQGSHDIILKYMLLNKDNAGRSVRFF